MKRSDTFKKFNTKLTAAHASMTAIVSAHKNEMCGPAEMTHIARFTKVVGGFEGVKVLMHTGQQIIDDEWAQEIGIQKAYDVNVHKGTDNHAQIVAGFIGNAGNQKWEGDNMRTKPETDETYLKRIDRFNATEDRREQKAIDDNKEYERRAMPAQKLSGSPKLATYAGWYGNALAKMQALSALLEYIRFECAGIESIPLTLDKKAALEIANEEMAIRDLANANKINDLTAQLEAALEALNAATLSTEVEG